jgi:L-threonylcarbamoyladenylate synthase
VIIFIEIGDQMKTKLFKINQDNSETIISEGAKIIVSGGLVVFPTETVYGIGANALNKDASKKIYQVKGRPSDNPLIVHIADKDDLPKYVMNIDQIAKKLIDAFWPGSLTLIFNKKEIIPYEITGGLETVAIRMPDNDIARGLIRESQMPICAPSANISGKPSSTLYEHVLADLFGKVEMIIDGGKSLVGIESTVLDLTTQIPTILRPGAITKTMIENILSMSILDATHQNAENKAPKAPGMKYKHYSPNGKITIVDGNHLNVVKFINQEVEKLEAISETVAVICVSDYAPHIKCKHISIIGNLDDPKEIASNLFSSLRNMDQLGIKNIYIHSFSTDDIGTAVMDRLLKAADNNIIKIK